MASTYSNLKFELIGTGDQSGTWGTTTNTNLGTAIEQAIVGMATISSGFVANSLTLTLTDTNAAQNARALVLNLTQALSGAGTLNVPAIQKPYMIINATGQTVTVKVTGQTGVAVPNNTRAFLYNNGTDVGSFFNYAPSLTLGTDLAVADGGTGASDAATARTNLGATTVGSNLFTLTDPSAITFLRINADNTVSALSAADFRTAIGAGTGGGSVTSVATSNGPAPINGLTLTGGPITSTGTVTLGGGVNVSTITTGILPVANGGTGVNAAGTSGNVLTSNGTAWVSQAGPVAANIQTFSATGTYTKPTGASFVMVEMWGAGGGGGGGQGNPSPGFPAAGGGGGGGGGYTYRLFAAPVVGATETVTVGAGGAAGVGGPAPTNPAAMNAANGGTTNFGSLLYAGGGGGGRRSGGAEAISGGGGGSAGSLSPFQMRTLATPASNFIINATMAGAKSYGDIVPGTGPNLSGGSFYGGGAGGIQWASPTSAAKYGAFSLFGGGGGGAGGYQQTPDKGNDGGLGGIGRAFGYNPASSQGTAQNTAGADFCGGGGGGCISPSSTGAAGGNGGLAAGGGGGAGQLATPSGQPGGAGGNGYAVVYSW